MKARRGYLHGVEAIAEALHGCATRVHARRRIAPLLLSVGRPARAVAPLRRRSVERVAVRPLLLPHAGQGRLLSFDDAAQGPNLAYRAGTRLLGCLGCLAGVGVGGG